MCKEKSPKAFYFLLNMNLYNSPAINGINANDNTIFHSVNPSANVLNIGCKNGTYKTPNNKTKENVVA